MRSLTLRFLVSVLALLTISRLALAGWLWPRVEAAGGLWPLMSGGLRIDMAFLAMVSVIPAVLSPWLGHLRMPTRLTAYWFRLCWMLYVLLEVSTPQFILEYDTRPNRLYIEYLEHFREVSAMLWEGYEGTLVMVALALILAGMVSRRLFPVDRTDRKLRWNGRVAATLVALPVFVLAARGTLAHRPLNAAMVAYAADPLVNTLALNSLYNVVDAAYRQRDERLDSPYDTLVQSEMEALTRRAAGLEGSPWIDALYPTLHHQQASMRRDKPLNLVFIIEESLGAQYVGSLGGTGLTPELDALSAQGWMFENAYATGTRSARGLEAILTGFVPTVSEAVLKRPRAQSGFFTLAGLLGTKGYTSTFLYGGESHFDNMRGFFLANGFDRVLDLPKFSNPGFVGSWGASDEDMFNELHALLATPSEQPRMVAAFSVSNHTPWEYPEGRIQPVGDADTVENTVRYADWALGRFFEKARTSEYWRDTIFLVIADHDARVGGASLVPVQHFHIPAVILGADVMPRRDARLVSQIDMAPTLLSLIGVDSVHPMPGMDLTRSSPDRAIMQYGENLGYLKGETLAVLEPEKPPRTYRYRRESEERRHSLEPMDHDAVLAREAAALAQWANWSYANERYRRPEAP